MFLGGLGFRLLWGMAHGRSARPNITILKSLLIRQRLDHSTKRLYQLSSPFAQRKILMLSSKL